MKHQPLITREQFRQVRENVVEHYRNDVFYQALAGSFYYRPKSLTFSPELMRLKVLRTPALQAICAEAAIEEKTTAALREIHKLYNDYFHELIISENKE